MTIFRFLKKIPYSRYFGFDRGMPIDRYYIEKFLENNSNCIKGDVIEIAESIYTKKFGSTVNCEIVMHVDPTKKNENTIIANLETGEGITDGIADCLILTQTLLCIFDVKEAIRNAIRLLRSGGTLLVTVPGITQISRFDMDRWGVYWSFTDLSLRRLFEQFVEKENIEIFNYGNVKSASAFLYGLASHEISKADLEYTDDDYQVLIAAKITK